MVRGLLIILSLLVFMAASAQAALAASFKASTPQTQVATGESFLLQLSLSGVGALDRPDLSPLEGAFDIMTQSQSTRTSIINGHVSHSIDWQVMLMPRTEGKVMIPAISVATDGGILRSEAFEINVVKPAQVAGQADTRDVFVQTELSSDTPYVNEPVLLTVKMVARKPVSNVSIIDFTVPNALTERQGEPEVYDGILYQQRVKVVDVKYLVTPLDDGIITIPPISLQGQVEAPENRGPYGTLPDAFSMMFDFNGLLGGWKPFAVASAPVTLNVRPPAVAMDPWLPVISLQVTEQLDGAAEARVGEPLSRKLLILADGVSGASLPSLQERIDPQGNFKVYADSPVTGDRLIEDGLIQGWREESYTLVPQQPGMMTLPEIRLDWWDLTKGKAAQAIIPARTITVKPGRAGAGQPAVPAAQPKAGSTAEAAPATESEWPVAAYVIVAGLGMLVLTLAGAVIYLSRQRGKGGGPAQAKASPVKRVRAPANQDNISIEALEKAQSVEELKKLLQAYAQQHWGMEKNAPLRAIHQGLQGRCPPEMWEKARPLFDRLDAALYAQKPVPAAKLRDGLAGFIRLVEKKPAKPETASETIAALNPS